MVAELRVYNNGKENDMNVYLVCISVRGTIHVEYNTIHVS